MTRILLVDGYPLVRDWLSDMISRQDDLMVCGQAEDGPGALEMMRASNPDLVVLDLHLRRSHGLELIKDLRARHPRVQALVFSTFDSPLLAERAVRAGARGFVGKQEASGTILKAIRRVLAGDLFLSEALSQRLGAQLADRPRASRPTGIDSLTDREIQVLEYIGRGFDSRGIAARMHLSPSTVDTYRALLRNKLQLSDAPQLLQYAIAWAHAQSQLKND